MTSRKIPESAVENLVSDLEGKANIALTNSPYTTNRILEIPQDIKLELNNGTLTLKAGSKVYVPNGFEADGTTPKFDEFITSNDSVDHDFGNSSREVAFLMTKSDLANTISVWPGNQIVSGTSAPDFSASGYWGVWYDTSNNIIKNQAGTNEWKDLQGFSLPFSLVSSSDSAVTSIDQVFNGFGYIGSTVFALPGVKVQTPNGRNEDGTYKSVIRNLDSVRTYNAGAWGTRNLNLIVSGEDLIFHTQPEERFTYNKQFSSDTSSISYDENTGYWWYSSDQSSWVKDFVNILGSCRVESGKITKFQVDTVDSVVNSNASNFSQAGRSYLSGLGMPSSKYIDLTLGASGTIYTAPANGYFVLWSSFNSNNFNTFIAIHKLNQSTVGSSFTYEVVVPNNYQMPLAAPVKQGEIIKIEYTIGAAMFRFYYAEGED